MTCITGIAKHGVVWIGGDSAGTTAQNQQTIREDEKVFALKSETDAFLLGCTTSFRFIDLLKYEFVPPPCTDENLHRYMVTQFVQAMREVLKKGGFAKKDNEQEEGGHTLVGFRGTLYTIESDYQVGIPRCQYAALGSASDVALGSLFTTMHFLDMEPERRLLVALQAAARHYADVAEPFVMYHTAEVPEERNVV